jgi:hypothetical protein
MITSAARIMFIGLSIGMQMGFAVAAGPPRLDVGPSCEAAVRFALTAGRDEKACFDDERTAQDAVTKSWSQYSADDKTQCVGMVNAGGPPSYVELQSCLEMMRDAATIQNDPQDDPMGNPSRLPASRRTKTSPVPISQRPPPTAQK